MRTFFAIAASLMLALASSPAFADYTTVITLTNKYTGQKTVMTRVYSDDGKRIGTVFQTGTITIKYDYTNQTRTVSNGREKVVYVYDEKKQAYVRKRR